MPVSLVDVGVWFGIALIAVVMFSLGANLGRRGAWEEGYTAGRHERTVIGQGHVGRVHRDSFT